MRKAPADYSYAEKACVIEARLRAAEARRKLLERCGRRRFVLTDELIWGGRSSLPETDRDAALRERQQINRDGRRARRSALKT